MEDITNAARAEFANVAIEAFRARTRDDPEDSLKDLLCDLMHWADQHPDLCGSFESALAAAEEYYNEEKKEEIEDGVFQSV